MALNDSLLEKKDFKSLTNMVQEKHNDMTYNIEDLVQILNTVKEGMQSTNLLMQYKSSQRKINHQIPEIENLFDLMQDRMKNNREEKVLKRLRTAFEESKSTFDRNQEEFEYLKKNDKNLDKKLKKIPDVSVKGSLLSATYSDQQQRFDDMPIVQVYDQEKFVQKREGQIKKIKSDAKDLNDIAININDKIYQQDGKLDDLNKELGKNVDDVKEANQNLAEAEQRSSKSNKKTLCLIMIITLLVLILIVFFLYQAGYLSGDRRR